MIQTNQIILMTTSFNNIPRKKKEEETPKAAKTRKKMVSGSSTWAKKVQGTVTTKATPSKLRAPPRAIP